MINIGVLGTANIAERRMIPAILEHQGFHYVGTAVATAKERENPDVNMQIKIRKGESFVSMFGGECFVGYEELLKRNDIDAVYIPLPPSLHYKWAKKALQYGKHVLMEKPFTVSFSETKDLLAEAQLRNLAVIENYGFCYHNQMQLIKEIVSENKIGNLRLVRAAFGFPFRGTEDFRYSKLFGGGALLDCGGYTIKAASLFLGDSVEIISSTLNQPKNYEVDVFGNAVIRDESGLCAQISFGMDNSYKCDIEIWGSEGYIIAPRIFTAPDGFETIISIVTKNGTEEKKTVDNQFLKELEEFEKCIKNNANRSAMYREIEKQSILVEQIKMGRIYTE